MTSFFAARWAHLWTLAASLVAAPFVLGLLACVPEEPLGSPGVRNVLLFAYADLGATEGRPLAANGATARLVLVPADPDLTFTSSDPSVIEITPSGELTTGVPGDVELIAWDAEGEVDRVRVEVVQVARIVVGNGGASSATHMLPEFEQVLTLTRQDDMGRLLVGQGGMEVTTTGAIGTRPITAEDLFSGRTDRGDFIVVTALDLGAGTLAVRSGSTVETVVFEVVGESEIDAIAELYRVRGTGGPSNTVVHFGVQALASGNPVAGARCRWTVEGAVIELEEVGADGSLLTHFSTEEDQFTATCEIGSVTHGFEVIVADLPQ